MLVLIDQLGQCKTSTESQKITHITDYVRTFNAILQKSNLLHDFIRRIVSPRRDNLVHTAKNASKYKLSIISQFVNDLLRRLLEERIEEAVGCLVWRKQFAQLLA